MQNTVRRGKVSARKETIHLERLQVIPQHFGRVVRRVKDVEHRFQVPNFHFLLLHRDGDDSDGIKPRFNTVGYSRQSPRSLD